ncbi:MAG: presqualene diphosphate synthase HpnD [bacterium]|nr:presqualene diphosphate synthase HpnD [bacterium]
MNFKSYCAGLVRKSRSNFYYAFLFLPKEKREAIFAAYAFSRYTDDLVDESEAPEKAIQALQAWRQELLACYNGTPSHPIALNLQATLQKFPIPQEHFLHLIEGVEMDLTRNRYQTFDDLYQYCYRVASAIGLICIEIFEYQNPATKEYAINLGLALQLTNILRDVQTDFQQNRIYLPAEDLDRFQYSEKDLHAATYNTAFIDLMAFQCRRAREYYEKAASLLPKEDRRGMFSADIMGTIYARLLSQIEEAKYNIFDAPIRLSNRSKFTLALSIWLKSRFFSPT